MKDTDFDEFLRASHRLFVDEIAQEVRPSLVAVPQPRRPVEEVVAAGTRARLAGTLTVLLLVVLVVVQPWRRDGTDLPAVAQVSPIDVRPAPDHLELLEPDRTSPLRQFSGATRSVLLTDDVYFLAGTARMRLDSSPALTRVWQFAADRSDISVILVGRASAFGDRTSALSLSRERANAVADTLAGHGVPRRILIIEAVGYDRPRFAGVDKDRSVSISVEQL